MLALNFYVIKKMLTAYVVLKIRIIRITIARAVHLLWLHMRLHGLIIVVGVIRKRRGIVAATIRGQRRRRR